MSSLQHQQTHYHTVMTLLCLLDVSTHQLSSDGQTGTVFLSQFDLDGFGILGGLQSSGQVLRSDLQADLIVLRRETFHLVLIKEVGLRGNKEKMSWKRPHHEEHLQDSSWLLPSDDRLIDRSIDQGLPPATARTTC